MASLTLTPSTPNNRFLLSHKIVEMVDYNTLRKIQSCGGLKMHWTNSDKGKFRSTCYKNEKQMITEYASKFKEDLCGVPIQYSVAKSGYGRAAAYRAQSLSNFRKDIRHTLCDDLHYDIDLVSCQPNILYHAFKSNNMDIPESLTRYVMNRDSVLSEVAETLKVEKEDAKLLFLRLMFFGTYEGFRLDIKETKDVEVQEICPPFVRKFMDDLKTLVPPLKEKNMGLWTVAKNSRASRSNATEYTKVGSTFMALFLQTYEFIIIDEVCRYLYEKTDVMKIDETKNAYVIYEFDGIKLLKKKVDCFPDGVQGILQIMHNVVNDKFMLPLLFSIKPMPRRIDLSANPLSVLAKEMSIIQNNHIEGVRKMIDITSHGSLFDRSIDQWFSFNKEQCKWEKTDHFLMKEYYDILKNYYSVHEGKNETYDKAYDSLLRSIGNASYSSGFMKAAKMELSTESSDFDSTNVINFKNGLYDIDKDEFRERTQDDLLIMSTKFDFTPYSIDESLRTEKDEKYDRDVWDMVCKIWPNDDQRELQLYILASGFCPVNVEKFIIYNGGGRNGKGVINNFMQLTGGDYVLKANSNMFTESNKHKSSSQSASPYYVDLHNVRYVYSTEPPESTPLQNSTIKEITGAVTLRARRLYKEPSNVNVRCTLVLETNQKPPLAEKAQFADRERIIDCPFSSQFTAIESELSDNDNIYLVNPLFKDENYVCERRNAFMNMLIPYIRKLKAANYKIAKFVPHEINIRSWLYCNESVPYYSIFFELFGMDVEKPRNAMDQWDKDPTVMEVVTAILTSDKWNNQDRKVKNDKANNRDGMKSFFETNFFFAPHIYVYKKQKFLKGWRRKVDHSDVHEYEESDGEIDNMSDLEI